MLKMFFILILMFGLVACSISEQQLRTGQHQYEEGHYRQSVGHIVDAAVRGNAHAQYVLGYMYYYGQGVPRDIQAAQYWIQQSAKRGYPQATMALYMFREAKYKTPQQTMGQVTFSPIPLDVTSTPPSSKENKKIIPKPKDYRKTTQTCYCQTRSQKYAKPFSAQKVKLPKPNQLRQTTSSNHYTIQLVGVHNASRLVQFIKHYNLEGKVFVYCTQYQNKPWFVVMYGMYPDEPQALVARSQLPLNLQQLQPFVTSFI